MLCDDPRYIAMVAAAEERLAKAEERKQTKPE
jgi:hypothetical protein